MTFTCLSVGLLLPYLSSINNPGCALVGIAIKMSGTPALRPMATCLAPSALERRPELGTEKVRSNKFLCVNSSHWKKQVCILDSGPMLPACFFFRIVGIDYFFLPFRAFSSFFSNFSTFLRGSFFILPFCILFIAYPYAIWAVVTVPEEFVATLMMWYPGSLLRT